MNGSAIRRSIAAATAVVALFAAAVALSEPGRPEKARIGTSPPSSSTISAVAARTDAISAIERFLQRNDPVDALVLIERSFPKWASDPPVAELRARAQDQLATECSNDACRFAAVAEANRSHPTPARADALVAAREALKVQLTFAPMKDESVADRLLRLSNLRAAAMEARKVASKDPDIGPAAQSAIDLVNAEKAKVSLIGSPEAVVSQLLGSLTPKSDTVAYEELGPLLVFVVYDKKRVCRGLYVVGAEKGRRSIRTPDSDPDALLSQALGHPSKLRDPLPNTKGLSRWTDASTHVVVRWVAGDPVELRVGKVVP